MVFISASGNCMLAIKMPTRISRAAIAVLKVHQQNEAIILDFLLADFRRSDSHISCTHHSMPHLRSVGAAVRVSHGQYKIS